MKGISSKTKRDVYKQKRISLFLKMLSCLSRFDDVLIQKNGWFVHKDLLELNPAE